MGAPGARPLSRITVAFPRPTDAAYTLVARTARNFSRLIGKQRRLSVIIGAARR